MRSKLGPLEQLAMSAMRSHAGYMDPIDLACWLKPNWGASQALKDVAKDTLDSLARRGLIIFQSPGYSLRTPTLQIREEEKS